MRQGAFPRAIQSGGRCEEVYTFALRRARGVVGDRYEALAGEREQAPAALAELLAQPKERRRAMVRNGDRFASLPLGDLLLERCTELWPRDASAATELAELALELVPRLDRDAYGQAMIEDLLALALAHRANGHRIRGELDAAREALARARRHLGLGSGDDHLEARVLAFEAELCRASRSFERGARILDRALEIYQRSGERRDVAEAMLLKAGLLREQGEPAQAAWLLRRALQQIRGEEAPRLRVGLRHALTCCMADLGEVRKARGLLAASREDYDRFRERTLQLQVRWVEGLIALGAGRLGEAESALAEVRLGLEEEGQAHDAALAGLDLARVYERQQRHADVRHLVGQVLPFFRAADCPREAEEANRLLDDAILLEIALRFGKGEAPVETSSSGGLL